LIRLDARALVQLRFETREYLLNSRQYHAALRDDATFDVLQRRY
jgi:hypothetical protein